VQEVAADGAVTVARTMGAGMPGGRQVVLPADYVRQHVELGYATTAHRAQGRTVDTAHAFVSVTSQREVLEAIRRSLYRRPVSPFDRASLASNPQIRAQTSLVDRHAPSSQRGVKGPFRAITRAITPGQSG
jgi:hypothetical protein